MLYPFQELDKQTWNKQYNQTFTTKFLANQIEDEYSSIQYSRIVQSNSIFVTVDI